MSVSDLFSRGVTQVVTIDGLNGDAFAFSNDVFVECANVVGEYLYFRLMIAWLDAHNLCHGRVWDVGELQVAKRATFSGLFIQPWNHVRTNDDRT